MTRRADRQEAAETLRRLLEAVEDGALSASTPEGRRILRRIEGAIAALDPKLGEPDADGRHDGEGGV